MQINQEDRITPQQSRHSHAGKAWGALIIISLLAAGGYYYFSLEEPETQNAVIDEPLIYLPDSAPETPLPVTEADQEESLSLDILEPETPHIIETEIENTEETALVQTQETSPQTLPTLNDSDAFAEQTTLELANGMDISPVLVNENILRRFVTFIDNFAQGELARKEAPLTGPEEKFSVTEVGQKTYLNPDSYHRYDLYADFLSSLDTQQLVSTYNTLKPLLNEAFDELGYPNQEFNSRLSEAIEQALTAPVIETPIEVYTISVHYKFVDPQLEALTPVQKQLIRTGPENTQKIQSALQRLQQGLTQ